MVSPDESAKNPHWWYDERYAIYDLSVNSAIVYPAHDEQLSLVGSLGNYRVKGYAYGGGGRRVTRVEISLDQGRTWRLSDISYPEDLYREVDQQLYGGQLDMSWRESCFCWCFWSLDIKVPELKEANDILVRSMDEAMNLQPRDMYWSVLGMMNNPWFRVAIIKDGNTLRFEHPTQPASMPGGWMERVKKSGGDLTNGYWGERFGGGEPTPVEQVAKVEVKMTRDGADRVVTIDELRMHCNADQPWFVLDGEVYDGTNFLREHPGGAQSIISAAGLDSTEEFLAIRGSPCP
jgi:nitrate reductase (NAD(P)H)